MYELRGKVRDDSRVPLGFYVMKVVGPFWIIGALWSWEQNSGMVFGHFWVDLNDEKNVVNVKCSPPTCGDEMDRIALFYVIRSVSYRRIRISRCWSSKRGRWSVIKNNQQQIAIPQKRLRLEEKSWIKICLAQKSGQICILMFFACNWYSSSKTIKYLFFP